ncbi:uncharacterized protein LOC128727676 [Anopheles nili]|uniref:uncharacterized protein LOC128727676 n=1 Tax=Anopheles nili TaxID=185578 RepID=UPI00237C1D6A|nr:uncharacterized protein LOC128727676 [Anopheles nili]
MDRSVDSIGSCSLDVDADSTDFSDTSGELNFLTPISGKDITREFTAGIKERCMLPVINCQAVTSVLDPVTGHISTVLTTTATANPQAPSSQTSLLQPLLGGGDGSSPTATSKKPSYLNLACCVNGYSNLTTYDSKLRQDINKSREVSPSRPIIATLHYNRTDSGTGGHLLTAPTLSYVSMNNTINNNYSSSTAGIGGNRMFKMNTAGMVHGGALNGNTCGRMRGMNGTLPAQVGGADMTDNAAAMGLFNGNGAYTGGIRTKVISSQSQISSHTRDDVQAQLMTPKKSFIQQRVEKLYGASEVVVLNKQNYSSSERKYLNNIANNETSGSCGGTPSKMVHHSSMAGQQQSIGNGTTRNGVANGHTVNGTNGASFGAVDENNKQINGERHEGDGDDPDVESLPVLRHLRPEFRAQLQIFSPKKVPKSSSNRSSFVAPGAINGNGETTHINGSASTGTDHCNGGEENANLRGVSKRHSQVNGNSYTEHFEQQILNGGGGSDRIGFSLKNGRTSANVTLTTSNGSTADEHHVHEEQVAPTTTSRNHSNAGVHTVTMQSNNVSSSSVVEQQEQYRHETSHSYHHSSSSASSSSSVIVEQKIRSMVVVSSTTADDGVERMSTATGSDSAIIAAVTPNVADVQIPPIATAASVIENGEQTGSRKATSSKDGLETEPASAANKAHVANGSGSEIVNCDSQSELVTADVMRTPNGSSTVVLDSGATAVVTMPTTMAVFGHRDSKESSRDMAEPTPVIEVTTNGTTSTSDSNSNNNNNVLDGNYFLRIMKTEQHRLEAMADEVEKEIQLIKADGVELSEDMNGYILAAVGKARLLCSQKMKQFEDLCYTNLNQSPDEKFQTTGEDLRGFWDMVMLQVNKVDASFEEIDSFRKNGWRKPTPKSPTPAQTRNGTAPRTKLVKRPYKTPASVANGGGSSVTDGSNGVETKKASAALAAAKREAQRKQLMEMKRKQKLAHSQQQQAVEIFAPASELPVHNGDDKNPPAVAGSTLVDLS